MTLEEQFMKWFKENTPQDGTVNEKTAFSYQFVMDAFIYAFYTGAKENGVVWHDLRKNPNDLPEDTYDVLDQAGYKVHYNFFQNVWVNEKDEIDNHVIAWCEIPQFKE